MGKGMLPRFFTMSCDADDVVDICEPYSGNAYPTLLFYRNNRTYRFDRPRTIEVMIWWTQRLSRAPIVEATTEEHLTNLGWAEPCMTLFLGSGMKKEKREAVYRDWIDISYDYMERYNFALVRDGKLTRLVGGNPNGSLHIHAHENLGYTDVLP